MRGQIHYENVPPPTRPDILSSGRPVVVVSASPNRTVIQVVPITSNPAKLTDGDPMHVHVVVKNEPNVALCEQLRTVRHTELRRTPIGSVSDEEMEAINKALRDLLGLKS